MVSQTTHTRELKIKDIPVTQHHLDYQTLIITNEAFIKEGYPRSSNWFYSTYPHGYSNNVFHTSNITASNPETSPHARGTVYEGNLLSSIMTEQSIILAALQSIEIYNGTNSKFEV